MKQTTDYNEVPECCKRCVYFLKNNRVMFFKKEFCNYIKVFNGVYPSKLILFSCRKNLHLPTKKKQCKKQKLTKKYRFIKFLIDEGIKAQYLHNLKYSRFRNDFYRSAKPKDFISHAFHIEFTPEGFHFWANKHYAWRKILDNEYKEDIK